MAEAAKQKAAPLYKGLQNKDFAEYDAVARPTKEQLATYPAESNAKLDYLVDELNKKATSNISTSGRIKGRTDGGEYHPLPLSDDNISSLGEFVNDNPFIQAEIANVRKDLTLPKNVREASDTSFDILNAVKKNIDDKINVAKRGGENELVRRLTGIKEELKGRISDATNGKYAEALGIYEDAFRFRDAAEMGRDVFNNRQSVAEFKQNLKKLSASEKDALKIGVRDEMVNRLGSVYNENVANKKFLVDKNGEVVERFEPTADMKDMEEKIVKLL